MISSKLVPALLLYWSAGGAAQNGAPENGTLVTVDCDLHYNTLDPACICEGTKWDSIECAELSNSTDFTDPSEWSRIVGGGIASKGDYPWFARAMRNNGKADKCGGMLVAPEYVLTAAHCAGSSNSFQIGAYCNNNNNCGQFSELIFIDEVYIHPRYNYNSDDNDFALVKLKRRSRVEPVEIDQGDISPNYNSGDGDLWAAGFGTKNPENPNQSTSRLQHVELAYVDQEECDAAYKNHGGITSNMICAADSNRSHPEKDSCYGDSGGPLYDANEGVVVGIVSFGIGCAEQGYPGVYSRISSQWDWIANTICHSGGHSDPRPSFCDGITGRPTQSPTREPTGSSSCQNGNKLPLEIDIKTDQFGNETSFKVRKRISNGKFKKVTFKRDKNFFEGDEEYYFKKCLPKKNCYKFFIIDEYGDGFGADKEGVYEVRWNGNQKANSHFVGGFKEVSQPFGNC